MHEIHSKLACFLSFNVSKQNFDGKINCYVVNIGVYGAIAIPRYTNRCNVELTPTMQSSMLNAFRPKQTCLL